VTYLVAQIQYLHYAGHYPPKTAGVEPKSITCVEKPGKLCGFVWGLWTSVTGRTRQVDPTSQMVSDYHASFDALLDMMVGNMTAREGRLICRRMSFVVSQLPKSVLSPGLPCMAIPCQHGNYHASAQRGSHVCRVACWLACCPQRHILLTTARLTAAHKVVILTVPLFALTLPWSDKRVRGLPQTYKEKDHLGSSISAKVHQPSPPAKRAKQHPHLSPVDSGQAPESCATKTLSAETTSRLRSPWYHFRSRPALPAWPGAP
jgi:hypothetical protein